MARNGPTEGDVRPSGRPGPAEPTVSGRRRTAAPPAGLAAGRRSPPGSRRRPARAVRTSSSSRRRRGAVRTDRAFPVIGTGATTLGLAAALGVLGSYGTGAAASAGAVRGRLRRSSRGRRHVGRLALGVEEMRGGPLEIPSIGVVFPGLDVASTSSATALRSTKDPADSDTSASDLTASAAHCRRAARHAAGRAGRAAGTRPGRDGRSRPDRRADRDPDDGAHVRRPGARRHRPHRHAGTGTGTGTGPDAGARTDAHAHADAHTDAHPGADPDADADAHADPREPTPRRRRLRPSRHRPTHRRRAAASSCAEEPVPADPAAAPVATPDATQCTAP